MHAITKAIAASALVLSCASCDKWVYDDIEPCQEGMELRFVYDYNMGWADAFASKVDCLTVLVYDDEERLVEQREETTEILRDPDYRMAIKLPAGSYHVVAYGGLACEQSSFAFHADPSTILSSQRTVGMSAMRAQDDSNISDTLLHDLYFGSLDVEVASGTTDYTKATVEMMKNTNNFRILLQQEDGMPLKSADFDLSILDDNVTFASDNSLVPSGRITRYLPWAKGETAPGTNEDGSEWTVAHYDLSTSRLITRTDTRSAETPAGSSGVSSPRLVIKKNQDGKTIADIPLVNYLLLLKGQHYASVGSQEFLDRQSNWNIILFLNKNMQWINTHIVVNDWVVRINDTEL